MPFAVTVTQQIEQPMWSQLGYVGIFIPWRKWMIIKMPYIAVAILSFVLSACAPHVTVGTGYLKGNAVEFSVREQGNGVTLDGYTLLLDGEDLGVLLFDGKPKVDGGVAVSEFKPLNTRFGIFDATRTININFGSSTMSFKIILDGVYVATVSASM